MVLLIIVGVILLAYLGYLASEFPLVQEILILVLFVGLPLFLIILSIYLKSPARKRKIQEKKRLEDEQAKEAIQNTMKKSFDIDFNVSFHIGSVFAIDKINDRIYLEYSENTMDYHAWLKPGAITDYSLSPEYTHYSTKSKAMKGAILAGAAGAVVGAASANESVATGNYILSITYKEQNTYKHHHSYTRCSKEEGQEVIRYIEQAQKK